MKLKSALVMSVLVGIGGSLGGMAHAEVAIKFGAPERAAVMPAAQAPGWHGDRYYDGHRTWERKDWEEHRRQLEHDRRAERRDEHRVHEEGHHDHERH